MTDAVNRYAESAYAVLVAGLAMIWPPLALIGCAGYLAVLAYITDRRTPETTP